MNMVLDAIALPRSPAGRKKPSGFSRADAIRADLAGTLWKVGGRADFGALVYLLLGRPDEAERILRRSYELLSGIGERGGPLATQAALLAEALFAQGLDAEAERFAELSARRPATTCSPGSRAGRPGPWGWSGVAGSPRPSRSPGGARLAVDTDGYLIPGSSGSSSPRSCAWPAGRARPPMPPARRSACSSRRVPWSPRPRPERS